MLGSGRMASLALAASVLGVGSTYTGDSRPSYWRSSNHGTGDMHGLGAARRASQKAVRRDIAKASRRRNRPSYAKPTAANQCVYCGRRRGGVVRFGRHECNDCVPF